MNSQNQNTATNLVTDVLNYLPELKQKFTGLVGKTNQMEQILIDAAFENYEVYLAFKQNHNAISVESTKKMKKLGENDHLQLASMVLYFSKVTDYCKHSNFIEADTKVLREIFRFYRESMLHFKCQKEAYKAIKELLNNLAKV
jgi:hypothetical protein